MPRVDAGGSGVMVASRPPSASAVIAAAAPPGAALATASMEPLANALACCGHSRIAVVDYLAGAIRADSVGAAGAGGGEHIDPAQGGQLDNEPAGDSTRAIDEQRFSTVKGQRLADHLLGGQRRHRKDRCGLP